VTELRGAAGILASAVGAWVVGAVVLHLVLGRAADDLGRAGRLALSFLLGIGVLTLWMVGLSLAGIEWSLMLVGAPVLAALIARARIHRRGFARQTEEREDGRQETEGGERSGAPLGDRVSGWVLAGAAVVSVLGSLREPIAEVDAVAAWAFHAKVFFLERSACPGFLTSGAAGSGVSHWPPLVPQAQAWGHLNIGSYDDRMVKLLFVAFYLAMLGSVAGGLRRAWDPASVRTLLVPLATIPALIVPFPAGSVASAYADVPLAAFVAAAAAALVHWESDRSTRWLVLAGLLAGAAPWVKREGLAFAGVAVLVVSLRTAAGRHGKPAARLATVLLFAGIVAASVAVLAAYKSRFPGPFAGEAIDLARLATAQGTERLGSNLRNLLVEAIQPTRWGILWALLVIVAVARGRHLRQGPAALAGLLLAGQILATLIGMTLSEFSPERMARLDMRRVLLHVAPLAALATGLLAAAGQRMRSSFMTSRAEGVSSTRK
jgi:hypothetical protein